MNTDSRLHISLLLLRLGVFVVMLAWTIDKFVRPRHAAAVFKTFYMISGVGNGFFYVVGVIELVIIVGFLAGYKKKWTYGAVLILHGISTFSSFKGYISPFEGPNLLFFAAWPMLAACFALFYLRDMDTLCTVGGKRS